MPSELRFVLILTGIATLAGAASVFGIYRQDAAQARTQAEAMTGGHVDAGKAAMARTNCGACHRIPGIAGATGTTGPALNGIAVRAEIAGVLVNNPGNMVRWLRQPQQVVPGNGMPNQGLTEQEARDMAAYLYTVKK
ncbi:c-type cytochrome [Sphingomonas sp. PL-96]|uniref:c-type cytochrome n=1 Tax=Sphingomonas sp. PL-96 TaxID=2887201 RepID=UPI001E2AD8B2|nr:c-type cytochrome [Sphingomonas sp. PL-96]MCC2977760.1 c-type cytochrome [Sphingomonas sp. PL-96]